MRQQHLIYYITLLIALLIAGCANKGVGPQGGPKDETPPKMVNEVPANGSVNFHGQVITLQFDEYVQLNDASNQVFISPPQKRTPTVKAVGKKVTVTFDDPLADSTTYTIDFGKAICDNNEKNPLEGYVFSFATGPEIDTLQIAGRLINAEDLNPMSGVTVGIHKNLSDSAFSDMPFTRIARTDDKGNFLIRNVHPGQYHLFALDDVSKDFMYQPGEGLAFLDTIFVPVAIDSLVYPVASDSLRSDSLSADSLRMDSIPVDTIRIDSAFLVIDSVSVDSMAIDSLHLDSLRWDSLHLDSLRWDSLHVDSLAADSLKPHKVTRYEPTGIVLRFFKEDKQRHYFERCTRDEQHYFTLTFAAPQDSLPFFDILTPPLKLDSVPADSVPADSVPTDSVPAVADSVPAAADSMKAVADTIKALVDTIAPVSPDTIVSLSDSVSSDSLKAAPVQPDKPMSLTASHIPDAIILQSSAGHDTLTFWLTDSSYIKQDTIAFVMTYMASDSVYNLVPKTDTIYAVYRAPRMTAKAKEAMEKAKARKKTTLEMSSNAATGFEIYNPLLIRTKTPVREVRTDSMHFSQMVDTAKVPLRFELERADSSGTAFRIAHKWLPETSYQLDLDSAAFVDIYGVASEKQSLKLTVRLLDEYSTLTIKVEPYTDSMMIQILSDKDEPVRTLRAREEGARFENMKPESYYVRVYEDQNGDSVWTSGDWSKHRQPEPVYYFPQKLTLRANWEFEETVKYLEKGILEQKPQEIVKDGNSKKQK